MPDDFAELVVACSVLTPAAGHGGEAGLAEMERACRPGGSVVIVWPNELPWLAARGYRHVSFDGDEMAVEFSSPEEAAELTEIFYPRGAEAVRGGCRSRVPYAVLGVNPPCDLAYKVIARMRVALVAPLVSAIREPQRGGSQAFISDLARGLVARGHDVELFCASGSEVPGVRVIETGVDPDALAASLYRASGPAPERGLGAAQAAFASVYSTVRGADHDVVHNHAFDAPAIALAESVAAPVVHTLHLPPEPAVARALQAALHASRPPTVATVSNAQASAWRRVVAVDAILPPLVPTAEIPWSASPGDGAVFAGRLSPEKGALEAIEIARAAGVAIEVYGDPYDPDYARERIEPRRDDPGVDVRPRRPTHRDLGGDGARGRPPLPRDLGGAVRDGGGGGTGVRDACGRIPERRAGRGYPRRRDRVPGDAGRLGRRSPSGA